MHVMHKSEISKAFIKYRNEKAFIKYGNEKPQINIDIIIIKITFMFIFFCVYVWSGIY